MACITVSASSTWLKYHNRRVLNMVDWFCDFCVLYVDTVAPVAGHRAWLRCLVHHPRGRSHHIPRVQLQELSTHGEQSVFSVSLSLSLSLSLSFLFFSFFFSPSPPFSQIPCFVNLILPLLCDSDHTCFSSALLLQDSHRFVGHLKQSMLEMINLFGHHVESND